MDTPALTDALVRVTFDIPVERLQEQHSDDRTPTHLSRYGEQYLANEVCDLYSGEVIVDSVRIELVDGVGLASDEPLTAQSEPKNLVLHLVPEEMEETIRQTLLKCGIPASELSSLNSALVNMLLHTAHNWLVDASAAPVAVAEELDLNAFRAKMAVAVSSIPEHRRDPQVIADLAAAFIFTGNAPTKRLQGQGLNREQLEGVIVTQLRSDGQTTMQAEAGADRLVRAIEAAQLDGALS
jgi:hypothetical protein